MMLAISAHQLLTLAWLLRLGLAFQTQQQQHHPRGAAVPLTAQRVAAGDDVEDGAGSAEGSSGGARHSSSCSRRSWIRRSFLAAGGTALAPLLLAEPRSSPASAATTTTTMYISPSEAKVTKKVFLNVRISRQDGTFYVRDDLPDTPENRVFSCRLVVGLFGENSPTSVERFLSYFPSSDLPLDDDEKPLPDYGRSYFTSFDQATGVLAGGTIPSLELAEIGGSTAIRYGGRVLPAPLWVERPASSRGGGEATLPPRVSHAAKGLLTHRLLDATPSFGVTTRTDTRSLDPTNVAFGTILIGESTGASEFLELVQDLPTYSADSRPPSMRADPSGAGGGGGSSGVVDDAAEAVFAAQRNFFRNAAKTLGDTRLDKVYEGKLLRRVQVTQVGVL